MSKLTYVAVTAMTKDEVLKLSMGDLRPLMQSPPYGAKGEAEQNAMYEHLRALFAHEIDLYVQAFEAAYASNPKERCPDLVEALSKEHGYVATRVFGVLTPHATSPANTAKAIWVHSNLCWLILAGFYPDEYTWRGPVKVDLPPEVLQRLPAFFADVSTP